MPADPSFIGAAIPPVVLAGKLNELPRDLDELVVVC